MDSGGMEPFEWAKFVIRNRDESGYADAYSIFAREARAGNPEAEYSIGLMYARGQGVAKDYEAAYHWLRKSYDHGCAKAAYFLGKMLLMGMGTGKDVSAAVSMFECVADFDARASYELGILNFTDRDLPRNLAKSAKWITMSAEAGNPEAQFVLGQYYKTGVGVEHDTDLALKWLTAAALNRHKGAMILLGNMYRTGDGVDADIDESDRWYDMADGRSNVTLVR